MRKALSAALVLLLLVSLCACTKREEPAALPTEIPATAVPTPAETPSPAPSPTPAPTATPEPEKPLLTVLRRGDEELTVTCSLVAVSPEVIFVGETPVNVEGVTALVHYLLSGEGSGRLTGYGGGAFSMAEGLPAFTEEIPKAGEKDLIRLGMSRFLLDSGLTEAVIPAFSGKYGYEVEIFTGSEADIVRTARAGKLDLLLLEDSPEADTFARSGLAGKMEGFETVSVPFLRTGYVLCGWETDPADVQGAASLSEAVERILQSDSTLLTHGEGSPLNALENALTGSIAPPEGKLSVSPVTGSETEALAAAREEGAYILTDPVSFFRYQQKK